MQQESDFLFEDPEILAEHFQESLAQVLANPDFCQGFYEHFFEAHPELQHFFVGRDLKQIQKKLQTTLKLLQAQEKSQPGIRHYLQMLGRMHQHLGVTPADFLLWKEALLETVAQFDPAYSEQTQRAWEHALATLLAAMTPAAQLNLT